VRARGYLVGASYVVGQNELMMGYGTQKVANVTTNAKVGFGYTYHLSKRTRIYTAVGRDSKVPTERTGYDLGLQHRF
jgi:predicted porin